MFIDVSGTNDSPPPQNQECEILSTTLDVPAFSRGMGTGI
jgi:hypothetical protein